MRLFNSFATCFVAFRSNVVKAADGECGIRQSNVRLQFLGGYNDPTNSSDECYDYRIHIRKYNNSCSNDCSLDTSDESLTWSLDICNSSYIEYHLQDYIKSVSKANDDDSYYVDDSTFYYTINNVDYLFENNNYNNNDTNNTVTICFKDDIDNNGVKMIAETEYCLDYGDLEDPICSNRHIFVPDMCGLTSVARLHRSPPVAGIDYVPERHKTYNIMEVNSHDSEHGAGLMEGYGTFEYDPFLTVFRSWWIDDCYFSDSGNSTLTVLIDDEYDEYFEISLDDMIDSPVTIPLYDYWQVPSQSCIQIGGIITDIIHDVNNEEYIFTLDLKQSALVYLNNADFFITKFGKIDLSVDDIGETRADTRRMVDKYNYDRRRMVEYYHDWWGTVGASNVWTFDVDADIIKLTVPTNYSSLVKVQGIVHLTASVELGLRIKYNAIIGVQEIGTTMKIHPTEANKDTNEVGYVGVRFTMIDIKAGGTLMKEIVAKRIETGTYPLDLGPIFFWANTFTKASIAITRSALGISFTVGPKLKGSFSMEVYYKKFSGLLGWHGTYENNLGIDWKDWTWDYDYPASDGKLEAGIGIFITPSATLGVYAFPFLQIGLRAGLPEFEIEASLSTSACSNSDNGIKVDGNFYVSLGLEHEFLISAHVNEIFNGLGGLRQKWNEKNDWIKTKVYGWTIDEFCYWGSRRRRRRRSQLELEWTGNNDKDSNRKLLQTTYSFNDNLLRLKDDYVEFKYQNDYKHVYVRSSNRDIPVSWTQANQFCFDSYVEYDTI